ncbi:FHA domain-containing protein [Arthrobacter sp. HY1533]|uniref:FHA domain-containing protein n=1 Tax=Arthrobacter sp. HY1533 TaxID=2970919 RepID=UPI0022B9F9CF|nr:FHA domain-containing protein [Arthrobacter sp. HY1533]
MQWNQPVPPAPAAPEAPARGSRRRKKAEQVDPFAPPAVQFHNQPIQSGQFSPAQPGNGFAPPPAAPAAQPVMQQGPITSVPGVTQPTLPEPPREFQPPAPETLAAAAQADDDAGETRVRPVGAPVQPLRLVFDDGRSEDVGALALIGRNPAGYDGEMISRLISVHDTSRSVSKTHLLVRASAEGLWVTDRNSTNGSAITSPAGGRTALSGGSPALAEVGSRVHFGDRSFVVGRA